MIFFEFPLILNVLSNVTIDSSSAYLLLTQLKCGTISRIELEYKWRMTLTVRQCIINYHSKHLSNSLLTGFSIGEH